MFRAPGIYKTDYINELFQRYGDVSDAPATPELPDWCFEDDAETGVDEDGHALEQGSSSGGGGGGRRREFQKKNPVFMEGVPGVEAITEHRPLVELQRRVQGMCNWRK